MKNQTPTSKPLVSNLYKTIVGFGAMAFWGTMLLRTYFGSFFITDILRLPATTYAIAGTVQSIMGFFIAPLIGGFIDNGSQGRFGKYRKWMLIAPVLHSICFTLCFLPVSHDVTIMTIYVTITWCLTTFTHSLVFTPYYTLHATIARTPAERTGYVSKRNLWVNIGKLLYSASYLSIIGYFAALFHGEVWGYTSIAVIYAVANVVLFLIEFLLIGNPEKKLIEERGGEPAVEEKKQVKKGPNILDIFKNISTNAPFGLVCINQFGFSFCASLRSAIYVYYYNSVISNPDMYALHLSAASVMGILATLALPQIAKVLENKQIAACSFSLQVLFTIGMRIFMLSSPLTALVFSMGFEFCSITNGSITASMFQDSAVYAEWKTGVSSMGSIIGASQVVGSISALICPSLIAVILTSTGYEAGQAVSDAAATGLVNAICLVPMAVCAISAVAAFFNPLNNKKLMQYQQEIAARK